MTRLIDADALDYLTHRECIGHGEYYDMEIITKSKIDNAPTVDIAFLCDGSACEGECHKQCFHTSDIEHARNFYKEGETWTEMLEV